jgi:hypothetical protein
MPCPLPCGATNTAVRPERRSYSAGSAWIAKGHVMGGLTQDHALAEREFERAVAVLEWGARAYADVPFETRGSVFRPTFVRGVRALRLNSYFQVRISICGGIGA